VTQLRVPWIRCRADEVDASQHELEWAGRYFVVLAHSKADADAWWNSLTDEQRNEALGVRTAPTEAGWF